MNVRLSCVGKPENGVDNDSLGLSSTLILLKPNDCSCDWLIVNSHLHEHLSVHVHRAWAGILWLRTKSHLHACAE